MKRRQPELVSARVGVATRLARQGIECKMGSKRLRWALRLPGSGTMIFEGGPRFCQTDNHGRGVSRLREKGAALHCFQLALEQVLIQSTVWCKG